MYDIRELQSIEVADNVSSSPGTPSSSSLEKDRVLIEDPRWNGKQLIIEPVRDKTNNLGFRPGPTQTGLYSNRRWLKPGNFGFRKKRNCIIRVAKTKSLISFAVTAKLICAFVFAYADCLFSHAVTQFSEMFGHHA